MVTAYSMFDNGGRRIKPTLIDRIQDRYGHTIYRHDQRECRGCDADKWSNQPEPTLVDRREQVIDPMTAYQITSMMEGVVQRGTATVVREVGKPIAGKTGTTNDEKDAWFIGFSPDIVGRRLSSATTSRAISAAAATGGQLAAPIVRDFLKVALADKPAVPFRVPPGIKLIRVDAKTGMRAGPGDQRVDPRSVQARHRAARQLLGHRRRTPRAAAPVPVSPDADRAVAPAPAGCTEARIGDCSRLFAERVYIADIGAHDHLKSREPSCAPKSRPSSMRSSSRSGC